MQRPLVHGSVRQTGAVIQGYDGLRRYRLVQRSLVCGHVIIRLSVYLLPNLIIHRLHKAFMTPVTSFIQA